MTSIVIPDALHDEALALCALYLRGPEQDQGASGEDRTFIWTPDLTAAELLVGKRILDLLRSTLRVTPDEWQSISDEVAGLTQYHGLANPTAAQTALAVKAIIRLLRVILRD